MNKSELIKRLAEKTKRPKKDCDKIVNLFIAAVKSGVKSGETVTLRGFGKFTTRHRSARDFINPKTGVKMRIEEREIPVFRPGGHFRDRLKNKSPQ